MYHHELNGFSFDTWEHPEIKVVLRAVRKQLGDAPQFDSVLAKA